MKRKTPQEKKALSYAKDRRNDYGENDKGSRKSIRRNKTFPSRAYRRLVNQVLVEARGDTDLENIEKLEGKVKGVKRRIWKKCADAPLGEFVKMQLLQRKIRVGGKLRRKLKIQPGSFIGLEK